MQRRIITELINWSKKPDRRPLVLKGARQVGKTFSLKRFGESHFERYHYFNFEKQLPLHQIFDRDLDPKRIVNDLKLQIPNLNVAKDLIIFDEIQACPKALNSLKYFFEEMPELAICAAGSLLGVHLSSEPFPVGSVDFVEMFPMSFEEFLLALNEYPLFSLLENLKPTEGLPEIAHDRLWELQKIYFVTGGLPVAVKTYKLNHKESPANALRLVRKRQEDLLLSYYADMAKHSGKINSMYIERILRNIPAQLAKELDGSSSRFSFKSLGDGLSRYCQASGPIDWLEKAGLLIKVPIANHGELPLGAYCQENMFKLYLFDVGLLGCLAGLSIESVLNQNYGTYKGYFAENFVATEFKYAHTSKLCSWKENSAEIEFLLDLNGQLVPVEVKSGQVTRSQSLRVFLEKYPGKKGVVLSGKHLKVGPDRKIDFVPLYLASRIGNKLKNY